MDNPTTGVVKAEPCDDLAVQKQRLQDAARRVDFLAPLRKHPYLTVATAATLGAVVAVPAASGTARALLSANLSGRLVKWASVQLPLLILRYGRRSSQAPAATPTDGQH